MATEVVSALSPNTVLCICIRKFPNELTVPSDTTTELFTVGERLYHEIYQRFFDNVEARGVIYANGSSIRFCKPSLRRKSNSKFNFKIKKLQQKLSQSGIERVAFRRRGSILIFLESNQYNVLITLKEVFELLLRGDVDESGRYEISIEAGKEIIETLYMRKIRNVPSSMTDSNKPQAFYCYLLDKDIRLVNGISYQLYQERKYLVICTKTPCIQTPLSDQEIEDSLRKVFIQFLEEDKQKRVSFLHFIDHSPVIRSS